jgi:RNA polymerase sigma factor (sigma-70 family)
MAEIGADSRSAGPLSSRMGRTDATDEMLARAAQAGDDDAFAVLFARYHRRLELYCRSIVRHEEDARDAAQNAMAKALVALRRHDGDLQVRPWLYRIAHNEAISVLRARRRHAALDEDLGVGAGDPLDELISRERLARTFASVRELPGEQREALLLRELMGLSHEEIGAAIGTSAARAKHVVFRARAALTADATAGDEDCTRIRLLLRDGDGRRRRSRVVRGHLRCCGPCRAWDDAHRPRARRRLVAAPAALAGWLAGIIGGAGGGAVGVAGTAKVAASIAVVAATVTPLAEDVARHPVATTRRKVAVTASAGSTPTPVARAATVRRATTTTTAAAAAPVRAKVPTRAAPRPVAAATAPVSKPKAEPAAPATVRHQRAQADAPPRRHRRPDRSQPPMEMATRRRPDDHAPAPADIRPDDAAPPA